MRFSKQDKINIYLLYQKGYPYSEIQRYYPIDESNFYYLIQILNRYGVSWLDRPRHKWTKEEKMEAIDRVLINHEIGRSVALDLGLSSAGMLFNWIRIKYRGLNPSGGMRIYIFKYIDRKSVV